MPPRNPVAASVLPQTPLAWLVVAAALIAAFAAGEIVGSSRAPQEASASAGASESPPPLFSDLQPPDLQRAVRSEGAER